MKPQRRMVLFVILTLFILSFTCNVQAEVLKLAHFSSRNFDLKVLTAESWEATIGKNPKVPRTDEDVLALARSIYPPLGAKPLPTKEKKWHCGDIEVRLLFAALQNPAITDETREAVNRIIIQAAPPLPEVYVSGRFRILYTTSDPDVLHNVTLEEVKAIADNLNASWNAYAAKFREPMHYHNGDGDDVIDVWLYYIDDETWGQTSSAWVHIEINSLITQDSCIRKITAAHELFHRVQYAYGYQGVGDDWLVEGTATWAEKFRYPRERDYMGWMDEGLETPPKDLFTRAYDAAHLFVYLTERSTLGSIRSTWANYQTKGAEQAFKEAVEVKTGLTFMNFLRNWHTANYVKDLRYAPAKYDYAEDEVKKINCVEEEFGPLGSVPVFSFQYEDPFCFTGSVDRYGADYVVFETPTNPRNLKIEITGGNDFSYRIIPIRAKSYLRVYNGNTNPFTFKRPSGTGKWTKVAVLVVGGASGGSYTITLGDKGCTKQGLKLMVGTPTINNQPYQWVYFTTEASLFWLSACGEGAGDQDWDPCDACAFPPFQYSGCTVAGGGFLTIGAGNSVNYTASALGDGASNSSLSAEINAEGNELKLSLSGDTFADPQGHYCDSRYYHWNSDSRSQIVVFGPVIDITNINDYQVDLEVSWNFTPTTTVGDDDSYSYQSLNASYAESYPCPSAISWPTGDWDELFTICDPIRPDLGCADPLSGTRTFSIDPGHVQHTLMLTTDTQSRVNKTCSDCSAPPPSTASFSGTITFRLGNTGP